MEMEDNRDETKESPRIRRVESNNNSIPRALSAKDGNNTSKLLRNTTLVFGKISMEFRIYLETDNVNFSGEMMLLRMSGRSKNGLTRDMSIDAGATGVSPKRGMVLPFTPLAMSFDEVNYYVDMPAVSSLSFFFLFYSQLVLNL